MSITQNFLTHTGSLESLYTLLKAAEIIAYLEAYPFLIDMLYKVHPEIQKYFPEATLFLEVVIFHGTPENEQLLVVRVTPPENWNIEKALETMNQFDKDWWLDNSDQTQGKLEIFV